jgi:sterol O-acyltransferase
VGHGIIIRVRGGGERRREHKRNTSYTLSFSPPSFQSVITIDESSLAPTPLAAMNREQVNDSAISKKGTSIPTSDGTIHVQPFRKSGSKQLRALVTFVPRPSHFGSQEAVSDQFRGFFTLFWMFLALFSIRTFVQSQEATGSLLSLQFATLLSEDLLGLMLSEVVLFCASLLAVPLVKAIQYGWVKYEWTSVAIQHTYQTLMLAAAIKWTFDRQWPWVQSGAFAPSLARVLL